MKMINIRLLRKSTSTSALLYKYDCMRIMITIAFFYLFVNILQLIKYFLLNKLLKQVLSI